LNLAWGRLSFRNKLLLAFLLIGIVPSLGLALFFLNYVSGSIELWQNPGVENLLENSLAMARESLAPHEESSKALARRLATSSILQAAVLDADRAAVQTYLDAALRDVTVAETERGGAGRPFAILMRGASTADSLPRDGEVWMSSGPAPALSETGELPAHGETVLHAATGVLWCRIAGAAGADGGNWDAVAGWRLDPVLAERARSLARGLPLYRSLGAYKRVRLHLVWMATGLLMLVLIVSAWLVARALAASLSDPIVKMVEGTRRVGTGDYEHRVEVEREDELGRLVTAFNNMTAKLGDQTHQLRRAERIAAWQEVARRLAHQIKNPLTPIKLSVHRLKGLGERADAEQRALLDDCLEMVTDEVENLRRIADEFSRFARLPEPRPQPVALAPLVRSVAELYHTGHPEIRLELDLDDSLAPVLMDADLTRQALSNLVKNAVEAMPTGGELRIALRPLPDRSAGNAGIRITVSDTGGGLPREVRERLFTPYLTTKPGGTGFGLALANRMVVDQGGSLEVLNPTGEGTTFQIDFPTTDTPEDS